MTLVAALLLTPHHLLTAITTKARTCLPSRERALSPAIARLTKSAREFMTCKYKQKFFTATYKIFIATYKLGKAASLLLASIAHHFVDSATISIALVSFEPRQSIVLQA